VGLSRRRDESALQLGRRENCMIASLTFLEDGLHAVLVLDHK
jgi:hypothetical protein